MSPHDTATSASTRFGIELAAWVVGPWAVFDLTGFWLAALLSLILLVGLPAVFNTPGDKNITGVAVPGTVRVLIEALLTVTALVGAWIVWPLWGFILVAVAAAALVAFGLRRYRWLLAGAHQPDTDRRPE